MLKNDDTGGHGIIHCTYSSIGIIILGNLIEVSSRYPLLFHVQVGFHNPLSNPLSQCLIHCNYVQSLLVSFLLKYSYPGILDHLSFPSHAVNFHASWLSSWDFPCFACLSSFCTKPRMVHLDPWCFPHANTTLGTVGDPTAFIYTIPHCMFIVDLLFHLLHLELLED